MENPNAVCALYTLAGFLSGSVMFSYLIPKIFLGIDVRDAGPDRNPGGINAMRAAGTGMGLLCIALDVLKGFIPVFAAVQYAKLSGFRLSAVVAAPVAGHAFSPWMNFRGGKAISPAFGVLLGLIPISWIVFLLALCTLFFKFIVVICPDSSCTCLSFFTVFLLSLFWEPAPSIKAAFLIVGLIVTYKIKKNPDEGEHSVRFGCFTLFLERNKIRVRR
jgi:glycerol-3-phosphate acyltransferase PlsY